MVGGVAHRPSPIPSARGAASPVRTAMSIRTPGAPAGRPREGRRPGVPPVGVGQRGRSPLLGASPVMGSPRRSLAGNDSSGPWATAASCCRIGPWAGFMAGGLPRSEPGSFAAARGSFDTPPRRGNAGSIGGGPLESCPGGIGLWPKSKRPWRIGHEIGLCNPAWIYLFSKQESVTGGTSRRRCADRGIDAGRDKASGPGNR